MSVKSKVLNYLKGVDKADKYSIRAEVLSWGRVYDQQSVDRVLQKLTKEEVLLSKKIDRKLWYKIKR